MDLGGGKYSVDTRHQSICGGVVPCDSIRNRQDSISVKSDGSKLGLARGLLHPHPTASSAWHSRLPSNLLHKPYPHREIVCEQTSGEPGTCYVLSNSGVSNNDTEVQYKFLHSRTHSP